LFARRNHWERARIERLRRLVLVHQYRLRAGLSALEEFDRHLAMALGEFDEPEDETDDNGQDDRVLPRRLSRMRPVLDALFEEMLAADEDGDWVTTMSGIRVPRLDEVNRCLRERGLQALDHDDLERLYIEFLNGE